MKTLRLSVIALLFSVFIFSCAKEEEFTNSESNELGIIPLADENMQLLVSQCPDCVADFNSTTATAAINAVLTLDNTTGALSAAGTTVTTIASTAQTYTSPTYAVGNVIVTVSHDATNIYFTFERNNATGGFESIRFHSPAQAINTNGGQTSVAAGTKKIQIVRSRVSLAACEEVTFSFRVRGGGNATVAGEVTSSTLSYVLRDLCAPSCSIEVGDFRTQTRGYWRNNNGKSYLDGQDLFPLYIGCDGHQQPFTTVEDVETFLESGLANGTPGVLPLSGTLGAQVLTLLINVKADEADDDFGAAAGLLSSLKVEIDEEDILAHPEWAALTFWNGKTVEEILALSQDVLGGCSGTHTPAEMNAIVTAINENFDNGTADSGLLTCGD